jgi:hypothetical protein
MDNKEYKQEVLDNVSLWYGFKNFNDLKKSLLQGDGRIQSDYQLDDIIKEAMSNYLETYFKNEFNKLYDDSDDHLID